MVIQTLQLYKEGIGIATIILNDIKTIIFYPQGAMWFLWACIIASYIIQSFLGTKHIVLLGVMLAVGYAFALICSTYYFMIDGTRLEDIVDKYLYYCMTARNGLFVGALFIWEGILISLDKVQEMVKKVAGWKLCLALVVSELFFVCEICYTYNKTNLEDNSLFIIFPVLIPIIVLLAMRYRMKIKLPYIRLRKISTSIYFMHSFILNIARIYISSNFMVLGIVLIIPTGMSMIAQKVDKPFLNKLIL